MNCRDDLWNYLDALTQSKLNGYDGYLEAVSAHACCPSK